MYQPRGQFFGGQALSGDETGEAVFNPATG
ncbi:MAG: hypothetical protein RL299_1993, partial [Pseudomonadota bacterium]